MNKLFLLLTFIFYLGTSISCSTSEKEAFSLLSSYKEQANQMANQAKMRMIDAAVKMYAVESGHDPESVDELVDKGYLDAKDILDQNGKKLPLTPSGFDSEAGFLKKYCDQCKNEVFSASKVGDRCPYCGVIWGYEKQMY